MGKISGISCDLETHLNNSLLHFMMAKRDRLESGAVLAEGCAVGVSLHYKLALFCFGYISFCFHLQGSTRTFRVASAH